MEEKNKRYVRIVTVKGAPKGYIQGDRKLSYKYIFIVMASKACGNSFIVCRITSSEPYFLFESNKLSGGTY